jgi:hypothetical protein
MKKRKTWRSKLTKKELRHLAECVRRPGTRLALADVEQNCKAQANMRKEGFVEPCWTCKGVAKKLGFNV